VPTAGEVWVVDTSSIIEIRRRLTREDQRTVYVSLTALVDANHLVFPVQVLNELKRWANPTGDDPPLKWTESVEDRAVSNPAWSTVAEVLRQVPEVLDPDKTSGAEEADPYILARALELKRDGRDVTVITEEKTNKPRKLSLSTAAGILKLPAVTMLPFLKSQGLLP